MFKEYKASVLQDEKFVELCYESEVAQSFRLFATPWTVAYQGTPSMGFSRQECWSGLPFPSPEELPNPGIEPGSPALQADALPSEPQCCTTILRYLTPLNYALNE